MASVEEIEFEKEYEYVTVLGRGYMHINSLHIQSYIRITQRYNNFTQSQEKTIEIGYVEVESLFQQKGMFTVFLTLIEKKAKLLNRKVFVELVHNENLQNFLKRRHYQEMADGNLFSYWF